MNIQKMRISINVYDEFLDPTHQMGINEEGFMRIVEALSGIGDEIEIEITVADD